MKRALAALLLLAAATVAEGQHDRTYSHRKSQDTREKQGPAPASIGEFGLLLDSEKPGILTFNGCDGTPATSANCTMVWGAIAPNLFAAGPTSGGSASWDFRAIVPADLGATTTTGYPLRISGAGTMDFSRATLLSNTMFSDTSNGTVVRGDLMGGNVTPQWARLAIGTVGKFLGTDGTDLAWRTFADLTAKTTPVIADKVPLYDVAGSENKYSLIGSFPFARTLYASRTAVTVGPLDGAALVSVCSGTIPGGLLTSTSGIITLHAVGTFDNISATGSTAWRARFAFGGTDQWTDTIASQAAGTTARIWTIDLSMMNTATNVQAAWGTIAMAQNTAVTSGSGSPQYGDLATGNAISGRSMGWVGGVTTSTDQTFDLLISQATNVAGLSVSFLACYVDYRP